MSKARHGKMAGMGMMKGEMGSDAPPTDVYAGKDSPVIKKANERKRGGKVMKMEGKKADHTRLDKPRRKSGGAVGADSKPMSSASKLTGGCGTDQDD